MLRVVVPLVSKILIDEFVLAKAYNEAVESGSSMDGLILPKSPGFSIGIAVVLFAMLIISAIFKSHADQRKNITGMASRSAVGPFR